MEHLIQPEPSQSRKSHNTLQQVQQRCLLNCSECNCKDRQTGERHCTHQSSPFSSSPDPLIHTLHPRTEHLEMIKALVRDYLGQCCVLTLSSCCWNLSSLEVYLTFSKSNQRTKYFTTRQVQLVLPLITVELHYQVLSLIVTGVAPQHSTVCSTLQANQLEWGLGSLYSCSYHKCSVEWVFYETDKYLSLTPSNKMKGKDKTLGSGPLFYIYFPFIPGINKHKNRVSQLSLKIK